MLEKHMYVVKFAKLPAYSECGVTEKALSYINTLCNALARTVFFFFCRNAFAPRPENVVSGSPRPSTTRRYDFKIKYNVGFFTTSDKLNLCNVDVRPFFFNYYFFFSEIKKENAFW